MAGLADLVTASQMAAAIDMMRFDRTITGFEFKPSRLRLAANRARLPAQRAGGVRRVGGARSN